MVVKTKVAGFVSIGRGPLKSLNRAVPLGRSISTSGWKLQDPQASRSTGDTIIYCPPFLSEGNPAIHTAGGPVAFRPYLTMRFGFYFRIGNSREQESCKMLKIRIKYYNFYMLHLYCFKNSNVLWVIYFSEFGNQINNAGNSESSLISTSGRPGSRSGL